MYFNKHFPDINVRIEPEIVYLDTNDLMIKCEYNSQSVKTPTWITIVRNGWYGKHDMVTMTDGNPPSIGYFFSGREFTNRMEVTGSIKEKFVKVSMKTVECLDEAHYECTAGGFNEKGGLERFTDSYSLVVNCKCTDIFITPRFMSIICFNNTFNHFSN